MIYKIVTFLIESINTDQKDVLLATQNVFILMVITDL